MGQAYEKLRRRKQPEEFITSEGRQYNNQHLGGPQYDGNNNLSGSQVFICLSRED